MTRPTASNIWAKSPSLANAILPDCVSVLYRQLNISDFLKQCFFVAQRQRTGPVCANKSCRLPRKLGLRFRRMAGGKLHAISRVKQDPARKWHPEAGLVKRITFGAGGDNLIRPQAKIERVQNSRMAK